MLACGNTIAYEYLPAHLQDWWGDPQAGTRAGKCPVVTGYGRLVMAEFDDDNHVKQSFLIIDQKKGRWGMYLVKRPLLPQMYWHGMLKGLL